MGIDYDKEIEKCNAKIRLNQARIKDLQRQKLAAENAEILRLVRTVAATPDELKGVLNKIKNNMEVTRDEDNHTTDKEA